MCVIVTISQNRVEWEKANATLNTMPFMKNKIHKQLHVFCFVLFLNKHLLHSYHEPGAPLRTWQRAAHFLSGRLSCYRLPAEEPRGPERRGSIPRSHSWEGEALPSASRGSDSTVSAPNCTASDGSGEARC